MYPLKFKPILKTLVWGGEKIAPFKEITTDQHNIGESWELSGIAGSESVVAGGAYDGFYGPGAGTFLLISFTAFAGLDVRSAAGQMKVANLACGLAALATFAAAGEVDWMLGLVAGMFGIAGHYIGASLVVKNGAKVVRPIIVCVLCLLFVKTLWDYLGPTAA